jgi:predicted secreted hydrolase
LLSTRSGSGNTQGILPGAGACDSARPEPVSLPADDAPHNETYFEWWWWYGHLVTPEGRRLGFTVLFASKPWGHFQMADYAITDLTNGTFHYGRQPLIVGELATTEEGFRLRGDHVAATGGDGHDALHVDVDGYELDLSMDSSKPPVITLDDGYETAYCNSFRLYSRMRMAITGTLKQDGRSVTVDGAGDFFHQWGFMPFLDIVSTQFLSFELDDGRDIFIAVGRLRSDGDEFTIHLGSISDAAGNATALHSGNFTITPTRFWQRDASCSYPVEYDVMVQGLRLHVRPPLEQAEVRATRWPLMYALWPAWPVYWDGETIISGDATGRGWLDLIRYCSY